MADPPKLNHPLTDSAAPPADKSLVIRCCPSGPKHDKPQSPLMETASMSMNVNNRISLNTTRVVARAAAPDTTATQKPKAPVAAQATPTTQSTGGLAALSAAISNSDVGKKLQAAMGAKSADEVVAAVTGGLVELAVERTITKDLDAKLSADYAGTIKEKVKNPATQKALLTLGEVLGDHVASELVSATAGAISGTTVKLLQDPTSKELYKTDKVAFGKKVAIEGGQNLVAGFVGAFGTAKVEDMMGLFSGWLQTKFQKK